MSAHRPERRIQLDEGSDPLSLGVQTVFETAPVATPAAGSGEYAHTFEQRMQALERSTYRHERTLLDTYTRLDRLERPAPVAQPTATEDTWAGIFWSFWEALTFRDGTGPVRILNGVGTWLLVAVFGLMIFLITAGGYWAISSAIATFSGTPAKPAAEIPDGQPYVMLSDGIKHPIYFEAPKPRPRDEPVPKPEDESSVQPPTLKHLLIEQKYNPPPPGTVIWAPAASAVDPVHPLQLPSVLPKHPLQTVVRVR